MDNLSEYQTPEIYDAEYGAFQQDFNFFLGLSDKKGACLDLACGTGRLTIALAKAGFTCIGMDASEAMLKHARKKSKGLNISYKKGNMKNFHFSRKFDLVTLAGNSFQALLTNEDQERLLNCVKSHLIPEGIFAFNLRNLNEDDLKTTKNYEFWHSFRDHKGQLVQVYGKQMYDVENNTVRYLTKRIWPTMVTNTDIVLRFTKVEELTARLNQHGFEIVNLFGDFYSTPFKESSKNIIIVCRLNL